MAARKAATPKTNKMYFLLDGYDNLLDEAFTEEAVLKLAADYADGGNTEDFYVIEGVRREVRRQSSFTLEG
jgi:hypothetical protein